MRYLKQLIILVLSIVLVGCGDSKSFTDPPGTHFPAKYLPKLNPHPKYFMTIKGHIDAAVKKWVNLNFIETYYTHSKQCRASVNRLEGVSHPSTIYKVHYVFLNKNGNYKIRIALDKYLPGKCKWKLSGLSYRFNNKIKVYQGMIFAFFSKDEPIKANKYSSSEIMRCELGDCSDVSVKGYSKKNQAISSRKNHLYTLDLYENKNNLLNKKEKRKND